MDEKERINQLKDVSEDLIMVYGQNSYFMADLDSILKAINDRIESIKKGEV